MRNLSYRLYHQVFVGNQIPEGVPLPWLSPVPVPSFLVPVPVPLLLSSFHLLEMRDPTNPSAGSLHPPVAAAAETAEAAVAETAEAAVAAVRPSLTAAFFFGNVEAYKGSSFSSIVFIVTNCFDLSHYRCTRSMFFYRCLSTDNLLRRLVLHHKSCGACVSRKERSGGAKIRCIPAIAYAD